ncbi:MAG: hypothetical protein LBQ80_03940 [Clostridium sp.]|nr:hypothetical protein [Clostridium sp.]
MTENNFRKWVKIRFAVNAALLATGAALIVLAFKRQGGWAPFGLTNGLYWGFAWGIVGNAIAQLIRCISGLKNGKELRKQFVRETDERNIALVKKAWEYTGYISLVALLAVAAFMSAEVMQALVFAAAGELLLFLLLYLILHKIG